MPASRNSAFEDDVAALKLKDGKRYYLPALFDVSVLRRRPDLARGLAEKIQPGRSQDV
jgi:hypothetical protein